MKKNKYECNANISINWSDPNVYIKYNKLYKLDNVCNK